MDISDLFSQRQERIERMEKGLKDVYEYESIPQKLRNQVIHIITELPQNEYPFGQPWIIEAYEQTHHILCKEYGVFRLCNNDGPVAADMLDFFHGTDDYRKSLDFIEVFFQIADYPSRHNPRWGILDKGAIKRAICELNHRFRENNVGYQYESGCIIKIDSQLIHDEVTKPALNFLSDSIYKGANEEFLNAHQHYRFRRYKECLNECLKALESTMKVICTKRQWKYNNTDTANRLIAILFEKQLIPSFLQTHFSGLRAVLESGILPLRNRLAGHGQGEKEIIVPQSVASYALHITAANIVLLVKADGEMEVL
jgi:hypothetical protein